MLILFAVICASLACCTVLHDLEPDRLICIRHSDPLGVHSIRDHFEYAGANCKAVAANLELFVRRNHSLVAVLHQRLIC